MATRLFKYLINDYYEEFCTNVTNWVSKGLTLVEHEEAERTLLGRGQEAERTLLGRVQEAERTLLGRVPEIWITHLLIGDAIPTNDAAARILWASVKENPLSQRIRFFLAVMKCMTHQTGLSAKSGVIGRAASSAGGHDLSRKRTLVKMSKCV